MVLAVAADHNNISSNYFTTLLVFFVFSLLGLFAMQRTPVKIIPSYSTNSISVGCSWPNANSEVVEKQVTSVLEGALNGLKGIASIRSITTQGSCNITIGFDDHVNMPLAQYEAANMVRALFPALPEGVSYPIISVQGQSDKKRPFMVYSILSSLPRVELQRLVSEFLLPKLSELQDIHEVNIYGAPSQHWHVSFDLPKMNALGIKTEELVSAVKNLDKKVNLGVVIHHSSEEHLTLQGNKHSEIDWANLPVAKSGDRIVYFGEIATASLEEVPQRNFFRINGNNTIALAIKPQDDANQLELSKKIKTIVNEFVSAEGNQFKFVLTKDNSEFIQKEAKSILLRSGLTLIILFAFVLLVSRSLRYLMIIATSIIANLAIAFLLYYLLGIELHLFSFAGITVSLGIIIDNSIVMIDHLRQKGNKQVFLALLASTLTTIGALSVIFFLSERLRLNMLDFALVIIVNLIVSLFIALFLIPALLSKINLLSIKSGTRAIRKRRRVVSLSQFYQRYIAFVCKRKWIFFVVLILGFGLPVYLLPGKLGNRNTELSIWEELYNYTFGSDFYNENLRKPLNYALGGTLRLFTEEVNHSKYFEQKERTNISMRAQMPQGATVHQMNELFIMLENYLSQFNEIDQFETSIYGSENARMSITFKEEFEFGAFPFLLKELLIQKAIELGSADWQVVGQGDGFNNSLRERTGSYKIELYGYNYEQLFKYATHLKSTLLQNSRIKEVNISGQNKWYRDNSYEFVLQEEADKLFLKRDHFYHVYNSLAQLSMEERRLARVMDNGRFRSVVFTSTTSKTFNRWNLENNTILTKNSVQKLKDLSTVTKEKLPSTIARHDQQYYLMLEYDFIGSYQLGKMHLDETLDDFDPKLPMGYTVKRISSSLSKKEKNEQLWVILLVVAIIYFVSSILLESLLQPLAVILMVPVAFCGVFLTFYMFDLHFDQGGFASFVLLSGLTVNSALYIINDMNNYRKRYGHRLTKNQKLKTYIMAYNAKIIPIILAIISTIAGLSPYLFGGQKETFWFPLAAGTTGGLLFSLIAIYVYLPLFFTSKK